VHQYGGNIATAADASELRRLLAAAAARRHQAVLLADEGVVVSAAVELFGPVADPSGDPSPGADLGVTVSHHTVPWLVDCLRQRRVPEWWQWRWGSLPPEATGRRSPPVQVHLAPLASEDSGEAPEEGGTYGGGTSAPASAPAPAVSDAITQPPQPQQAWPTWMPNTHGPMTESDVSALHAWGDQHSAWGAASDTEAPLACPFSRADIMRRNGALMQSHPWLQPAWLSSPSADGDGRGRDFSRAPLVPHPDPGGLPLPLVNRHGTPSGVNHNEHLTRWLTPLLDAYAATLVLEEDRMRIKALEHAIGALTYWPSRVDTVEQARAIPGLGASTLAKITEILGTGRLRRLQALQDDPKVQALTLFDKVGAQHQPPLPPPPRTTHRHHHAPRSPGTSTATAWGKGGGGGQRVTRAVSVVPSQCPPRLRPSRTRAIAGLVGGTADGGPLVDCGVSNPCRRERAAVGHADSPAARRHGPV
jgi:hypothetical protein